MPDAIYVIYDIYDIYDIFDMYDIYGAIRITMIKTTCTACGNVDLRNSGIFPLNTAFSNYFKFVVPNKLYLPTNNQIKVLKVIKVHLIRLINYAIYSFFMPQSLISCSYLGTF